VIPEPHRLSLRSATPADAPRLAELHRQGRRAAVPTLREVHDLDSTVRYFTSLVPRRTIVVAEAEGAVLGFVAVDVPTGELEHLYLDPGARRRGIGSRLLDVARELCPGGLALWTFQANAEARAFYEARGFVLERTTDGSDNEEREPDARYRWG
jgi:GNAT superfamily N-acetyltransferase